MIHHNAVSYACHILKSGVSGKELYAEIAVAENSVSVSLRWPSERVSDSMSSWKFDRCR